jgi:hypothetical protein
MENRSPTTAQVPNDCTYLGNAIAFTTVSGASYATMQVAQGQHQVRTEVYAQGGGTLQRWQFEYDVTTP